MPVALFVCILGIGAMISSRVCVKGVLGSYKGAAILSFLFCLNYFEPSTYSGNQLVIGAS